MTVIWSWGFGKALIAFCVLLCPGRFLVFTVLVGLWLLRLLWSWVGVMGRGEIKSLLLLLRFSCFPLNKHSLGYCKSLVNLQSYNKVYFDPFASTSWIFQRPLLYHSRNASLQCCFNTHSLCLWHSGVPLSSWPFFVAEKKLNGN